MVCRVGASHFTGSGKVERIFIAVIRHQGKCTVVRAGGKRIQTDLYDCGGTIGNHGIVCIKQAEAIRQTKAA